MMYFLIYYIIITVIAIVRDWMHSDPITLRDLIGDILLAWIAYPIYVLTLIPWNANLKGSHKVKWVFREYYDITAYEHGDSFRKTEFYDFNTMKNFSSQRSEVFQYTYPEYTSEYDKMIFNKKTQTWEKAW